MFPNSDQFAHIPSWTQPCYLRLTLWLPQGSLLSASNQVVFWGTTCNMSMNFHRNMSSFE